MRGDGVVVNVTTKRTCAYVEENNPQYVSCQDVTFDLMGPSVPLQALGW
jgi:hypothetical protein